MPSVKNAAVSQSRAAPSRDSAKPNARASLISDVGTPSASCTGSRTGTPSHDAAAEVGDEVGDAGLQVEHARDRDARRVDAADLGRERRAELAELRDDRLRRLVGARLDDLLAQLAPVAVALEHDALDRRAAEVEAEVAAHRAVQPPSTVSTAPVTNGAVAR